MTYYLVGEVNKKYVLAFKQSKHNHEWLSSKSQIPKSKWSNSKIQILITIFPYSPHFPIPPRANSHYNIQDL